LSELRSVQLCRHFTLSILQTARFCGGGEFDCTRKCVWCHSLQLSIKMNRFLQNMLPRYIPSLVKIGQGGTELRTSSDQSAVSYNQSTHIPYQKHTVPPTASRPTSHRPTVSNTSGMWNWGSPEGHMGHIVLSWGPHTTTNWSHLIKIIAYCYYLNLEICNVLTNSLAASHIHECKVMK
jgi:hypothetical protein